VTVASDAYALRKQHADAVFASLEELPAGAVELLARALMLGGGIL
jgi:hypothetical protein